MPERQGLSAPSGPFESFFLGGFECSTHVRANGARLDLLRSTQHDQFAEDDYLRVHACGMRTVRDGTRWHLIERQPGLYDWDSWLPMLRAARDAGVQVIWDLCHYGHPNDVDIFSTAFINRFARYSRAVAQLHRSESDAVPFYCPVNEMSFWAWAGGEMGHMGPATLGRGDELKRQLVRAYIVSVDAIRSVDRRARFIVSEPLINVIGDTGIPGHQEAAEAYRLSQFQAHDMLIGRSHPELGGSPDYLDLLGVNFYPHNQWYLNGNTIPLGHHSYRPLHEMLVEVFARYQRPMLISETGAEGRARPYWLHHVCAEVWSALEAGVPIEGLCLYPILDYHGWENSRLCEVGLLSMPAEDGDRTVYMPLMEELRRQQKLMPRPTTARERFTG